MNVYELKNLDKNSIAELIRRPAIDFNSVTDQVTPIIRDVKEQGDEAVRMYTQKFDGVEVDPLYIPANELIVTLPEKEQQVLDRAMDNIRRFHMEQRTGELRVETMPGIVCMKQSRPIENVGLYIPGGSAPLPSTALMLGVPAMVSGCRTIVFATPPDENGNIPPSISYIARKVGAAGILKAGGAQAIAAMAYGTETVPAVDKIFGPGNQYVTAAKMLLQNSDAIVSIDLPAGPSEVLVVAGADANPEFIAADLLSQAEHGPDSQVVLVALKGFDIDRLKHHIDRQLDRLPRKEIARGALKHSFILQVEDEKEALEFSNRYAPEHLILNVKNAGRLVEQVRNAGSVFLGPFTPESLGDYASGTNHTLPTYGYARMYSGVSLSSFQKSITFQTATEEGLKSLGPVVEQLADMEGLQAHKNAVSIRLANLEERQP